MNKTRTKVSHKWKKLLNVIKLTAKKKNNRLSVRYNSKPQCQCLIYSQVGIKLLIIKVNVKHLLSQSNPESPDSRLKNDNGILLFGNVLITHWLLAADLSLSSREYRSFVGRIFICIAKVGRWISVNLTIKRSVHKI